MSALQKLPALGSGGGSAGGLFDNLKLSLLAGYAMAQNARLPVFTGAEIGAYQSGVDGLDAACANIDGNVRPASQYVLGVVTTAFLNDLELPDSSATAEADTSKQKSWLEALSGLSLCAAINPCENTYILGFDGFSTPPINTEVGQFTFSLLRAGFSYGAAFNASYMDLQVHNAWSYDWSKRNQPGTLTDVTRAVNVLLGGGVTWGLDLSAEEGGPTLASIALEAEADLGIATVGGSKEVIIATNARGPTLTIADVIELDFTGLLDLGQNIQFRYSSKSDFFFQYVLYASANNDISGLLQDAPVLSDLLYNIVTFEGSASLAVQVDAVGAAVRIEVDGSFSIADDIASQFDIPPAGGQVSILLTKKHKESDFRVTLVINGKAYCVGVYNRGAGHGVDTCAAGTVKDPNGLLCYPACRAGYYMVGPVCWQSCPSGYTNTGAHCLKPAPYGRGAGYPWKFGDGLSFDAARKRCEKANPGGCEKNGEVYYPKCRSGYSAVGCCTCSPSCPSGMTDIGVSCQKQSYGNGAGYALGCGSSEDKSGTFCYPQCKAGYTGVGFLCWQFTCSS
ncbi:hypothetical protein HXX76_009587 [Chlamydomonas incerta]|uniref:Uncharacterized protein n=1 Tax=Chlamydomonas incerta TaxID=51695 RepID=A0A835SQZ4_CHLIN|nr:hypothetical protein HXX76_009587 [Chlamydomonas incerta]|eukprot:KAG2431573.1 hypothetical protein HXX76_009587 [Chlamydomonas incerta]